MASVLQSCPRENKAGQPECGAIFVQQAGGKWFLFGDVVVEETDTLTWPNQASGNQWGIDSPDGVASDPNYLVTQAGEVRAIDRTSSDPLEVGSGFASG